MKKAFIEYGLICLAFTIWNILDPNSNLFYHFNIFKFMFITGLIWFVVSLFSILFQNPKQSLLNVVLSLIISIFGIAMHVQMQKLNPVPDISVMSEYSYLVQDCPQAEWIISIHYDTYDVRNNIYKPGKIIERFTGNKSFVDFHIKSTIEILKFNAETKKQKIIVSMSDKRLLGAPQKWLKENNLPLDYAL